MPDVKFSNLYPYTDFHELNLDWVIKEVKFWSERVGKSIQKIEKTGTTGLVDTYTITYSDGTTSTFDVTNGNGIASVAKTGTVGLVDTYTITFQDGSTTTFEVHNGTASIDDTLSLTGWAADAKVTGNNISALFDLTGFKEYTNPQVYNNLTVYTNTANTGSCFISNRIIPKNSYIDYMNLATNGATTGKIFLINNSNEVVFVKSITTDASTTVKRHNIGFVATEELRVGIANLRVRFNIASMTFDDHAFATDGLYESTNIDPSVGDVLTVTKAATRPFFFAFQWIYSVAPSNSVSNTPETSWLPQGLQLSSGPLLRYVDMGDDPVYIGRWYPMTVNSLPCMVTNNCGSEIHFKVSGCSTVTISFEAMTATNAYFCYSIDGGTLTRRLISNGSISIPDTDAHYVRIITDGITENIGKWTNGTGFAVSGITVDTGAIIGVFPRNPLIMFFGDSITEGIRALGIDNVDMGNTNSATGAFPWFACEKLGAVSYRVGYGASGITVDGSFHIAIDAAQYYYNGVRVDIVMPDAIVINHGTNDNSASTATFVSMYNEFLAKLREMYPGVKIFIVIPFGQNKAADIRTVAAANPDVALIETSSWTGITKVDGTHPSAAGAQVAGEDLADAMLPIIYGS